MISINHIYKNRYNEGNINMFETNEPRHLFLRVVNNIEPLNIER